MRDVMFQIDAVSESEERAAEEICQVIADALSAEGIEVLGIAIQDPDAAE